MEEWRSGGVEEWRGGGVEEWRSGGVEEWRSPILQVTCDYGGGHTPTIVPPPGAGSGGGGGVGQVRRDEEVVDSVSVEHSPMHNKCNFTFNSSVSGRREH